ncbi:MAG TPA: VIT and VWA domain-containing protein [Planctomycetota bacterium]|nr:VIT and VWA domain-containing protein [Planctomycetota bacterium]
MNRPLLALPFLLSVPLAAQGLLIGPAPDGPGPIVRPPQPGPRGTPVVKIVRTAVHADIVDGVATTSIDQVFRNEGTRDAEGTWFLPLPMGAVADGFTMTVGGKEVVGEVLDASQARSVYETIVRQRRDPGLLEYAGEGMLRARIYPIPACGEVGVTVRLRQILQPTGGVYEWVWPLRSTRLGDAAMGPIGLDVRVTSQTPLSTIIAPYANAEIKRIGEHEATVTLEGSTEQFEDLRVLYGLSEQEFGLHLLAFRQTGDPGYFTMLLSPPRSLKNEKEAPRRCVQLVVDTSGSMAGDKIEQAKAAVRMFLRSLRPNDLFQVVTFASAVQTFFEAPRMASAENIAAAMQRVDQLSAMGGTNISGALQQALAAVSAPADGDAVWLPQIVFVTDGQPTMGLTNPQQILELTKSEDKQATRVFALGVGDEIDVRLLDDLVQQHRGARDFVRNKEKIEMKVDALCRKIAEPALTDVEVRCDGLDSFDVHPTRTSDLFCGEMLQVVGRYRDAGKRTVVVRGKQNGVAREFVFQVEFPAVAAQHSFVQTLWARQHVTSLLDAIRRNGQKQELIDEVRRLATRYGIVTPYTSQLIVEEGMRLAGPDRRAGGPGGAYHGPADSLPAPGGGRGGVVPSGPATGGPAGRDAGAAADPASPASRPLIELGRTRTGKAAVEESLETGSDSYYLGAKRKDDRSDAGRRGKELLMRAAGRVFVVVGSDLVEQGLPDTWQKQAVVIESFSDAYFALLKAKPELREILALGERVVFRDGERIVHVKPGDEPKAKEPAELPAPKK